MIEDDVEALRRRVEQLEACCRELREKIRPERLVPDIYRFDEELVRRLAERSEGDGSAWNLRRIYGRNNSEV